MYCVQIHCTVCTACRCESIPLTVDLGPCLPYRVPKSHILSFQYTPAIERERKRSRGGGSVCGLHQQVWQRPQTDIAARTPHVPLCPVASREAAAESASPCLPLSAPPATWTLTPPHRTPPPRHPPGVEGLRYGVCVSTCIPINAHLSTLPIPPCHSLTYILQQLSGNCKLFSVVQDAHQLLLFLGVTADLESCHHTQTYVDKRMRTCSRGQRSYWEHGSDYSLCCVLSSS